MEEHYHLTKDLTRFFIIMIVVVGAIFALDIFNAQTGWVDEVARQLYAFLLQK